MAERHLVSVWKEELREQRNDYEDACLRRLAALVSSPAAASKNLDTITGESI
jgi:hypothetical protein